MTEKLSPITPSEILRSEFMEPLNLTNIQLAEALNLPLSHIDAILDRNQTISSELALRLSRYFGNSAEFWLNLQQRYNLKIARQKLGSEIEKTITPLCYLKSKNVC